MIRNWTLSAQVPGAMVLAETGRMGRTGRMTWSTPGRVVEVCLRRGRAVSVNDPQSAPSSGLVDLRSVVRSLAASTAGSVRFASEVISVSATGVDTLAETLVGLLMGLTQEAVDGFLQAHRNLLVAPHPSYDQIAAAIETLGGARPAKPSSSVTLGGLATATDRAGHPAVMALVALGGLRPSSGVEGAPSVEPWTGEDEVVPFTPLPPFVDPEQQEMALRIDAVFQNISKQNHYEVLGIEPKANETQIRDAYYALAKVWHSDAYRVLQNTQATERVEAIFRRIGEAFSTLTNHELRQDYDYLLDRERKGLPTDPSVILEAEGLFRRGQTLIRRGQAAAALEPLSRAIALNRGEKEFLVYYGFALHAVHGSARLEEAVAAINNGMEGHPSATGLAFLGSIYRVEGRLDEASKFLKRALDLDPNLRQADLELRLIRNRRENAKPGETKKPTKKST